MLILGNWVGGEAYGLQNNQLNAFFNTKMDISCFDMFHSDCIWER